MSRIGGRGRGFGRGHRGSNQGGRGGHRSNGHSSRKNNNTTKPKTRLEDHIYHVGSAQQASDYVTNTNFIVNYIKKTYDMGGDIGQALEKLEHQVIAAPEIDTEQKTKQGALYDILFKTQCEQWVIRKNKYEDNKVKAYALLYRFEIFVSFHR